MSEMNPWESIEIPSRDVSARRVDHTHPLNFFWAKDHQGRYLFFCEFEKDTPLPSKFPDLIGVEVFPPGKERRLVLLLKSKSDWEIFLALCTDIVKATQNIHQVTSSVAIIINRLNRWREFLTKAKSPLLSEDRIKGLMGELIFLKNHLMPAFGVEQSIEFWRGPDGYSQDFEVNDCAIEVKCQSGVSSPQVKISSEDQLCSQMPNIFLHVVTLGRASQDDSMSVHLPSILQEIRTLITPYSSDCMERFNDKVFKTGYINLDAYMDYSYIHTKDITYRVIEGFPRICRRNLYEAIKQVKYTISLSHCEPYLGFPDWMERTRWK